MLKVEWIDGGREPQCAPNPKYPEGVDIDLSVGMPTTCSADLPYPAKRCGAYLVQCEACDMKAVITTAGRADDPRSIKLPCQVQRVVKH